MQIIETLDDFTTMVESSSFSPRYLIPILGDTKLHPAVNTLSVLFIAHDNGETYLLLFDHNDGDKLPSQCKQVLVDRLEVVRTPVFVPNKKTFLHVFPLKKQEQIVDMVGLEYIATGNLPDTNSLTPLPIRNLYARFQQFSYLNRVAPLMKLLELCEAIVERFSPICTKYYGSVIQQMEFLNVTIIPVTYFMEKSGVHVEKDKFIEHYGERASSLIHGGLVYTDYNPYTKAGRVTNRHRGINFSAINKSDGTREAYTSRHDNGAMVLIDWESFHLRLIAEMIGFDAPKEAFHVYLAKQYFQVDDPTPEQYEEGKKITFQNLYSSHRRTDVLFFQAVTEWETKTWALFENVGYLTLPGLHVLWKNRMEDPSPSKMFNYILQWMESYTAFRLIDRLRGLYKTTQSVVTLFTYDSLLIDYSLDDDKDLLSETVKILEDGGRFPVRVYMGDSYHSVKNISQIVKNS